MRLRTLLTTALLATTLGSAAATARAQVTADAPSGRPVAIIDLGTDEGARLVRGQWRYSDVRIVEVDHRAPGVDLRPSGPPTRTYDITPHAGDAAFDDAAWP